MPDLISPAIIMVVAALAIGVARGHLRTAIVLLAPILTLWAVWQVPDGVQDTVRFLSYQIEPVEGSPLRRLFATIFALMAFVGGLYAFRVAKWFELAAAYFYAAGWPVAAMVQLSSTKGMELHSFSDDDLKKINDVIPAYIPSAIPANVYEGIDYEVKTPAVSALLVVSSDLSDDLVYGITAALWNDNTRKLLDNGHAKGRQITAETALDGVTALGVPLHPGAERFYKEAGLME